MIACLLDNHKFNIQKPSYLPPHIGVQYEVNASHLPYYQNIQHMPPKTFKRPSASQQVTRPKPEQAKDPSLNSDDIFLNPKHMMENKKAFDRMRLLTTILAGVLSGLLNLNQLEGPFLYLAVHLVLTGLLYVKVGKVEKYFKTKTQLFGGMGSGLLLFICIWMIVVNIVYVL